LDSREHMEFTALWLERVDSSPDPHIDQSRFPSRAGPHFVVEDEITRPDERSKLAYYNDIAIPGRREWWATIVFPVAGRKWCLPMYRQNKSGAFDPLDAPHFLKLVPHLTRIISSTEKISDATARPSLLALDTLGCAAVLLDDRGCVSRSNQHAQALFGSDLIVRHGRIHAKDRQCDGHLQALIAAQVSGVAIPAEPVIVRKESAPWLLAETMQINALGQDMFGAGRSLLFFTNLMDDLEPSDYTLRSAFELTAMEARLAGHIAKGCGIDAASMELGIGRETARSHLKAIFDKTRTRRQAELAALVARYRRSALL